MRRRLQMLPGVVGLLLLVGAAFPYPAELLDASSLQSTRVYDRHGVLIYEARSEAGGYGEWVELDEISEDLVQITLSSEDAHFRSHPGVDPSSVVRAAWLNLRAGRIAYGGSTLTMQLAELIDPREHSFAGKVLEAVDAVRLETTLDKDAILTQYLNRAPYGRQARGVEAGARRWFGKSADDLRLDEAALLAILPRAPSFYDLERHPERALARRRHVLMRMVERGWLDREEALAAADAPIEIVDPSQAPRARHVLDRLANDGSLRGGSLHTTVDLALTVELETRVRAHLAALDDVAASQAGVVVLDNETGAVLAMVGSRAYDESDLSGAVNATTAARHPGSALKPFVYALALEGGDHPFTLIDDAPTAFVDYRPRSASGRHHGTVTYREALGSSLNVPAVLVANAEGPSRVASLLSQAGLSTIDPEERHGVAIALGAKPARLLELAAAYAAFPRGGRSVTPHLTRGAAVREPEALFSPQTAFLITDMLSDPAARSREFGLETPLDLPFPVAVKTGTSESFCDNVVVGFTPDVTVAVWVGNFDGSPMHDVLAMRGAAPLFRDAMIRAMDGREPRSFARAEGVERGRFCGHSEYYDLRHAPADPCPPGGHRPRGTAPMTIRMPADGAQLLIDPLLPRERQRVRLRAEVTDPTVREVVWEVDGESIARSAPPFEAAWTIASGVHRIRAIALGAAEEHVDDVEVRVSHSEGERGG